MADNAKYNLERKMCFLSVKDSALEEKENENKFLGNIKICLTSLSACLFLWDGILTECSERCSPNSAYYYQSSANGNQSDSSHGSVKLPTGPN